MSSVHPTDPSQEPVSLSDRRLAFGAALRQLREERGISIGALAQTTRISIAFLNALESGHLEKLPGQVFGRGFVRSITKSYGVNGDDLTATFETLWAQEVPRSVLKVQIKSKPVRVRSERVASLIHNTKSLVRRGVLLKVAAPIVVGMATVYWLATATGVHRAVAHLTERSGAGLSSAKPLHLQEVPPPAGLGAPPETATPASTEPSLGASATAPAATLEAPLAPPTAESLAAAAAEDTAPVAEATQSSLATPAAPSSGAAAPPSTAKASITAAKSESAAVPEANGEQVLELTVTEPVRIRMDVDKSAGVTKELKPDTYRLTFNHKADMLIYNASAVKISFNGKQLGSLGSKGRVRRLSFQAQLPNAKKM